MQGLKSYRNRQKKNYRGWTYNRIIERLDKKPSKAIVVYLCGPEDIDRTVASWKGFDENNMFAVDMNKKNIQTVRKGRSLAYHGNICQLIYSLGLQIDVIHADFCCGFTDSVYKFMLVSALSDCVTKDTVMSVNLQRGREFGGYTDEHRKCLSSITELLCNTEKFSKCIGSKKHRGFYYFVCHINEIYDKEISGRGIEHDILLDIDKIFNPAFYSYSSSRIKMDSVVFKYGIDIIKHEFKTFKSPPATPVDEKRKIAAIKAIRTMRIKESYAKR